MRGAFRLKQVGWRYCRRTRSSREWNYRLRGRDAERRDLHQPRAWPPAKRDERRAMSPWREPDGTKWRVCFIARLRETSSRRFIASRRSSTAAAVCTPFPSLCRHFMLVSSCLYDISASLHSYYTVYASRTLYFCTCMSTVENNVNLRE